MDKHTEQTLPKGRPKGQKTHDPLLSKAFGQTIRINRIAKGISQESLAHLAQIERAYMGRIERGEHTPLLPQVMKIARALGMRPGELLDETEKIQNQTQKRSRL